MTPTELENLKSLAAKATKGPYESADNVWGTGGYIVSPDNRHICSVNEKHAGLTQSERRANAAYIAAACNALPSIIAELELMRLERDVLALNRNKKDSRVFVVYGDGDEVMGVTWPEKSTGSDTPVLMPKWYTNPQQGA